MKNSKVVTQTQRLLNTKRSFFFLPTVITLVIIGIQVGLLLLFRSLPPQLPLFYSLKWGESRLASPTYLWMLPASASIVMLVTFGLVRLTPKDRLLQRIIFWSMPTFAFLLLITLYNILVITS
jgi:hypothetical protein